jgi:mycofactocin precursor
MLPDAMRTPPADSGGWAEGGSTVDSGSTVDAPVDTAQPVEGTGAGEVEDTEELLVEEISIDGMCGVY